MRVKLIGLLIGLVIGGVMGCTSKDAAPAEPKAAEPAPAPEPAAEPAGDPVAEAQDIYKNRCTVCHGVTGKGDGDGSAALDPKPRDFTSPEWQAEVTDDHLTKIIVYGGAAVGKAPTMPANPDLDAKPEVVAELVKFIRGLKK
ncbi:MAG: cytochrome c [Myxococcales bacterium]|nr:MAG: cytochrome c [Myxococcales bacterium]